jgi:quercetin dioxygenase-like cupin family protein
MHIAPLASGRQHVSLVEFHPGAQTHDHTHPSGEEIFVLSGELRDANERYPAGTWLRLHPGARHAPFAEVPTVILLRHGHLRATPE